MMNTIKILLIVFTFPLFFVCCIAHKKAYQFKDEKVSLQIDHQITEKDINLVSSIIPGKTEGDQKSRGLAFALPYIFKMGINQTLKMIDKEYAKYIARYSASASDDMFYTGTESDADINIKALKIVRTVTSRNKEKDTALVITLGIEQSADGFFLRFVTKDLRMSFAKTKVAKSDPNIDIKLCLSLLAFWFDGNKEHVSQEIANVEFIYKDIPFYSAYANDELANYKSTWFPILPRTAFSTNKFGTGNFKLDAEITEYDNINRRTEIQTDPKHANEQKELLYQLIQGLNRNR
jgi:hypothetical protein